MRAKVRAILDECIRTGTIYGYRRAHKHSENPSEEHILQTIDDAIWSEIDDKFDFDLPPSVYDIGWK